MTTKQDNRTELIALLNAAIPKARSDEDRAVLRDAIKVVENEQARTEGEG